MATWKQVPHLQAGSTFAFGVDLDHERQVALAKRRVEQAIPKRWITPTLADDEERLSADDSEEGEDVDDEA